MYRNLLVLLRITVGLILLLLGIIGIFIPFLQGWLLVAISISLISPEHGRKMVLWAKGWKERFSKK